MAAALLTPVAETLPLMVIGAPLAPDTLPVIEPIPSAFSPVAETVPDRSESAMSPLLTIPAATPPVASASALTLPVAEIPPMLMLPSWAIMP